MTDQLSLQTLIDRATISDQVYRYTKGLDTRDWELIASLFSNPFHLHAQMLDDAATREQDVTKCKGFS